MEGIFYCIYNKKSHPLVDGQLSSLMLVGKYYFSICSITA